MILSVPGKTFLLGEYVALDGGPSLLLSTEPRFELRVRARSSDTITHPFHPASPAGRFFERHLDDLKVWEFEFHDPSEGRGGLGASSAQFALLYAFYHDGEWRTAADTPWAALLREYRACAWDGVGAAPSGADVVSQLSGGITWFDGKTNEASSLDWAFEDIAFTLFRTGFKLATHEHLKGEVPAPHEVLRKIVLEADRAFATADSGRLIEAVNAASLVLRQSGLTATATTDLLDQMRENQSLFYAAKGCGAMGADIVVALHARASSEDVFRWASGRGLEVCGSLATLSGGLEKIQDLRGRL